MTQRMAGVLVLGAVEDVEEEHLRLLETRPATATEPARFSEEDAVTVVC